jgi:hypothetical protein
MQMSGNKNKQSYTFGKAFEMAYGDIGGKTSIQKFLHQQVPFNPN